MKYKKNQLIKTLADKLVNKHVVCPSAILPLKSLSINIPDAIEIIDERSAGYVATGICDEIESPVVVWVANNDSFRNLTSALTEAYYRKLPILVVALPSNDVLNQTINPYDIIRYYPHNVEEAVDYLFAEVQGPVLILVDEILEEEAPSVATTSEVSIDASAFAKIIPTGACIHIGSGIVCDCEGVKDVVSRNDHCTKDGNVSMLIGSSLMAREQLHIGLYSYEDVAYDLNMLGNRHVGNNMAIVTFTHEKTPTAIFSYAQKMEWDCKLIRIDDAASLDMLKMTDKPQYIEVSL